jgi:hypothetical protein
MEVNADPQEAIYLGLNILEGLLSQRVYAQSGVAEEAQTPLEAPETRASSGASRFLLRVEPV